MESTLEPVTRIEQFLSDIIDQGGGGGGSGGGGVLIVNDVNGTLDKTWQEINDAVFSVLKEPSGILMFCAGALVYDGEYIAPYFNPINSSVLDWTASSASGYPSLGEPEPDPGPSN